jgi:hypothetical protein
MDKEYVGILYGQSWDICTRKYLFHDFDFGPFEPKKKFDNIIINAGIQTQQSGAPSSNKDTSRFI